MKTNGSHFSKRIIALLTAALTLIAVTAIPLRFDRVRAAYSTPEGYNANDYQKMLAFLLEKDANGVTNGKKINSDFTPGDPETWEPAVSWKEVDGEKRVKSIDWVGFPIDLVGKLDLSGATAFRSVYFDGFSISSVDFSGCTSLYDIRITDCPLLASLNVSGCTALETLICKSCALTGLDVSDCTGLTYLDVGHMRIPSVDLSANTKIESLFLVDLGLKKAELNRLTAMIELDIRGNDLVSLDLSGNGNLRTLLVSGNRLTKLSLKKNTKLLAADCSDNLLTSLDVPAGLGSLNCSRNELTSLDLSGCHVLSELECRSNKLTTLIYDCTEGGTYFDCTGNEFTEVRAMMISGQPANVTADRYSTLYSTGHGKVGSRAVEDISGYRYLNIFEAYPDPGYELDKWLDEDGLEVQFSKANYTPLIPSIDPDAPQNILLYAASSTYTAVFKPKKLDAPEFKLSSVPETGKIRIEWEPVEGATAYRVYRADTKEGEYKLLKTTENLSLINVSAEPGSVYWYKVRAIGQDGVLGKLSSAKYRTCRLAQPVVKGGHVASTGKNTLSWEAVPGAAAYKVYRSEKKSSGYKLIKTTENVTFTNVSAEAGKAYYYKVVAVHENTAANSAASEVVGLTCDLPRPVVKICLSNGHPKLSWEAVAGAVGYKVYRSESSSGPYKLLKTTENLTFTNTSAVAGTKYYYKVMAVAENPKANSALSSVVSIKAK